MFLFEVFLFLSLTFGLSESTNLVDVIGIERLSLDATREDGLWSVQGINPSTQQKIHTPAAVPGGVYTDLEKNHIFNSSIYHEYNDLETKWVGRTNWTFTRKFAVTQSLLEKEAVVLVCEGLDTVAEVFINEQSVGQAENMFVRYVFDAKTALKVGQNEIKIAFQSPVGYALNQYKNHEVEQGYAVRPEKLVPEFRGEDKAQFIRKMQSSFSWDWGPSYPSSGIWKNIYIEGYNSAVIRDILIFTSPSIPIPDETSATEWSLTARVYYDCAIGQNGVVKFKTNGSDDGTLEVELVQGSGQAFDIILIRSGADTKLWWPNGYGDQNLYNFDILLEQADMTNDLSESSSRQVRIGFRTVELIEDFVDPDDVEKGREFYFQVNGVKMYSKGSNAIPLHVLPERITEKQTEWLLMSAKKSHQNMIRVWGGGMYESDTFYDRADEYGILIWQDFVFACALYPATDEFLANVHREVETQVKRLQNHPSLALWAGNNENEGGLRGGWFGYEEKYESDYIKLYVDTIKSTVDELDPSRRFLISSPTNGKKTEEEGWIAWNPGDLKYGDIHAYDYFSDNWDWQIYRRARYSSEYGYQSFPHYETLTEVANDISKWTWKSQMMEHRQRHPRGQEELRRMIREHFPFPKDYNSSEALPYMLYMAQLSQCMAQKTQTEFYRRLQDKLGDDGTGHNMGALYWQLNDVWEGCSWSSIEVNGRWKLQMYYAKKFFAPVLASPYKRKNGNVIIELISDSRADFRGTLQVQVFKLDNSSIIHNPVYNLEKDVEAKFLTSKQVFLISHYTLQSLGCDKGVLSDTPNPCIVYTTLAGTPDNFLFLQYPRNRDALPDPKLKISSVVEEGDGKTVRFYLENEAIALFVYLNVQKDYRGYFSDNGFIQAPQKKEMTYYSEKGITASQFLERVQVMSLYNVTKIAQETPPATKIVRKVNPVDDAVFSWDSDDDSSESET